MHLRPKTKRRVGVLIAVMAIGAIALFCFFTFRMQRLDRQRKSYRAAAMADFNRGDYPSALAGLTKYLSNDVADPEAIYAYAVSLGRVPTVDRSNLTRSISAFRRYLDLKPDDVRARRQLLDLYARSGFASEGLSLADQLLQNDPDDVAALTTKVHVLELQSQYAAALPVVERLDRLQPNDLSNQTETYRLMRLAGRPGDALIARADASLHEQPTDARRTLLRAIAAYFADAPADARRWLDTAAALPPPDAEFVRVLSNMFDRLGLYDRSLACLEKGADQRRADAPLLATLVLRQWQDGLYDDAANRLATVDPTDAAAGSRLLALRALIDFTRSEEAGVATSRPTTQTAAAVDLRSLDTRASDETAATWSMLLHARFDKPPARVRDRIRQYEAVLVRDPDNAVAPLFLGLDDLELGERDMAVQAWQQAARLSPGWATPHLLTARTLLDAGRIQEAAQAAQAAEDRAPDRLLVQTTLARAAYAQLPADADQPKLQRLLAFVGGIQTRVPQESATLPIYVSLLARTGHAKQATEAVRQALSSTPPPNASTLNALLRVNDEQKLGLKSEIETSRNRNVSVSPGDGLNRALAEADDGRPDDGLALLQDLQTAGGGNAAAWKIALLRYREYISDGDVRRDWSALGNDYPRDAAVQRAVLASTIAWADRPLIDRTINQLKKITGDQGVDWRLSRARFELGESTVGEASQQARAAEASALVAEVARDAPQSVDAQLLWSEARRQLGDAVGAFDHCRRAAELGPMDVRVSLAMAQLLVQQGKTADADALLGRAAATPRLSNEQRIAVARALASRGQYDAAIELLSADTRKHDTDRDLLRATIRQSQGDAPAAAALYTALLKEGVATEPLVRAAAWFFADHGQADVAKSVLAKLDRSTLSVADRESVLADFDETFGDASAALTHLRKAAAADASRSIALAGFDIRRRHFGDVRIAAFKALMPMLPHVPATAAGDRLLDVLSRRPSIDGGYATVDAVVNHPETLDVVARQFPSFLPAQLLLADRLVRAGAVGPAADVLARAAQVDPTDPAAVKASVELFRSTGQWDSLVTAATEWRRRSMQDPLPADLALADGYLHDRDAAAAVRQLSPYVAFARSSPDANQTVLRLQASSLCATGQDSQARALLQPLIDTSPAWRAIWLRVAGEWGSSPEVVASWIDLVAPMAQPAERLAVAQSWAVAGRRFSKPEFLDRSRHLLTVLTGEPNAPAPAWIALAEVCRDVNDLPAAVTAYGHGVRLDPNNTAVSNDYAFALFLTGGDLHAARTAAEAAVAARPADPSYQTTLGRIEFAAGDTAAAEASLQKALHADPNHRPALIALAELQAKLHRLADLPVTLERIDSLAQSLPVLSADDTRRLDAVRRAATQAPSTTGPA